MIQIVLIHSFQPMKERSLVSASLARCLAYAGQSVLLLDLDHAGVATTLVGATVQKSGILQRVLDGRESDAKLGVLARSIEPGLDLIPADSSLQEIQCHSSAEAFVHRFSQLSATYSWLVFDSAPMNPASWNILSELASFLIVPVREHTAQNFIEMIGSFEGEMHKWMLKYRKRLQLLQMIDCQGQIASLKPDRKILEDDQLSLLTTTVVDGRPGAAETPLSIDSLLEEPMIHSFLKLAKELIQNGRKETRSRT